MQQAVLRKYLELLDTGHFQTEGVETITWTIMVSLLHRHESRLSDIPHHSDSAGIVSDPLSRALQIRFAGQQISLGYSY